jgi:hypothetical protein
MSKTSIKRQIAEHLADPTGFVAWVQAHPEGAVIGQARWAEGCPLARYLWERLDAQSRQRLWKLTVYHETIGLVLQPNHEPTLIPLPAWAQAFACTIDRGRRSGKSVRRHEVLAVLQHTLEAPRS